ncbi:MAG: hypothetical protein OXI91_01480 [Chloroflexota bacterium]|nr:hypothetical protein [Chloroflexota bacterium]
MTEDPSSFKFSRFLLGLAGSFFVAALVLAGGVLIILGTRTDGYLALERTLERFVGG